MKIGVIMGGSSHEREISLLTGQEIINNLDRNKYEVIPIEISCKSELIKKAKEIDFAFIALHGSFGEDGTIQGTLETMGIPYSGSGVLASALCMDKDIAKRIFIAENITTPRWTVITKVQDLDYNKVKSLEYPLVVKPNNGGSSVGTYIVYKREELENAIIKCLNFTSEIIVEEYIKGEEITCPILGGNILPIISIKTKAEFFNYEAKYSDKDTIEEIAILPKNLMEQVEKISIKIWKIFKLKSYARVDMIIKDERIYVLEINTLPGMTKNSLLPKSAAIANIEFKCLLDKIIEYSWS